MILVYTVIFSQIMRAKLPGVDSTFAYSIYLCAGVLTWGLFAEIIGRGQNVFIENANLLKKLSFPRICLPIIVVLNAGLNFAIIFGLFTGFLILSGNFPGEVFLAVFPVLVVQIVFSIGLGITLGVLNVFFRDVGQFFGIFLQFWFWFTPIVYPLTILPEEVRPLLVLNPWPPSSPPTIPSWLTGSGRNGKRCSLPLWLGYCFASWACGSFANAPAKWWTNYDGATPQGAYRIYHAAGPVA